LSNYATSGVFRRINIGGGAARRTGNCIASVPAFRVEKPPPGISRARVGPLLVAVDEWVPRPALKSEPARAGSLFPHLYRDLTLAKVTTGRHP
jgi:uncharacterized protein (DUF952 family)